MAIFYVAKHYYEGLQLAARFKVVQLMGVSK